MPLFNFWSRDRFTSFRTPGCLFGFLFFSDYSVFWSRRPFISMDSFCHLTESYLFWQSVFYVPLKTFGFKIFVKMKLHERAIYFSSNRIWHPCFSSLITRNYWIMKITHLILPAVFHIIIGFNFIFCRTLIK